MKQVFLELLVMGNMGKEDALALGNMFVDIVKPRVLRPSMFPERRVIRLANQTTYSFKKRGPNPANPNSALYTYYQVPFLSTFFSFLIWVNYLGRTTKRGYECIALCAGSNMRWVGVLPIKDTRTAGYVFIRFFFSSLIYVTSPKKAIWCGVEWRLSMAHRDLDL